MRRTGRDQFDSVGEAEQAAARRLPSALFRAIEQGSGAGETLRANRAAFSQVTLSPHVAVRSGDYAVDTRVLDVNLALPVLIAPTAMSRIVHPEGELGLARGAGASGTIFTAGWGAGYTVDEIANTATTPLWQNVIWCRGREGAAAVIERAKSAGYHALVATVDLAVGHRRGPTLPPVGLRTAVQFAPDLIRKPKWLWGFVKDGMDLTKASVPRPGEPNRWVAPSWDELRWIRDNWGGKLVIKGVLRPQDAEEAVRVGADAIVVSNHGGKGVDGVPAALQPLPEIVAAVDGRIDVLMDGGIRTGMDVIKALCLGARAVLVGRPCLYGLAVAGGHGVHQVLEILRSEVQEGLTMLGCKSVQDLGMEYIYRFGPPTTSAHTNRAPTCGGR
jgi:isopentenyl diphosphate isomerase/L-lactate dehydrogenase-like FMN-dependent dehydrogenase